MIDPDLLNFPCACVVDIATAIVDFRNNHVQCPWCDATFEFEDLRTWAQSRSRFVDIGSPRTLLRNGDTLFEVVDQAGPYLLVRTNGGKTAPLKLTTALFEVVRN